MIVIFGQISAYSAFNLSHFSRCGSASGKMASAGHSGSHTPQSLVGMDHQHVVALVETIDRAHFDAIHIFALDAIVSDHVGHHDFLVEAGFGRKNNASFRLSAMRTDFAPNASATSFSNSSSHGVVTSSAAW